MKKTRIILAGVTVSVVLLACLGFLGYYGVKTIRRSHLRAEARNAFAAEDWKKAETLLSRYVGQDPNSEEDFVRLAQVYRHFGNTDEEMHCWYKASMLNPLKPEYWDNYTGCAMNARNFSHLYSTLSRKLILNAELSPKDRILYLFCAARTNHARDAEKDYERLRKKNPNLFRQNDLTRFTEFLVTSEQSTPAERSKFLNRTIESKDPVVRLESILLYLVDLEFSDEDVASIREKEEAMLKQAIELNRFAATPFLANVYFSQLKFQSVIELAEPYLADIDHIPLSVLYAESCVYDAQPEKLKPLAERFRSLGLRYRLLASYFDALYDFSLGEKNKDDLVGHMQEARGVIQTDLANLINLQIALNNDTLEKICTSFETIMKNPPFYDLQARARSAVRHYLESKIVEKPELAEDPRMVKLAQLISGSGNTDPLPMRIMISDLYKRNMLTRQILQENLDAFPFDPYLLQVAAEYELFNGNPEQCLTYTERFFEQNDEKKSSVFDLLHMLALELTGHIDEAAKEYAAMVDNTEMNRGILYRYFRFCIDHERRAELSKMAERLSASSAPDLKALAPFFQAEDLFLQGKKEEALSLLETAKTDNPDFALYAANRFSAADRLDQALSRFLALVGKYPDKRLILANTAEVYLAKGMKAEALSCAKQSWETNHNDQIGQFVYAKMLAANGKYQEAEEILSIPHRQIELVDEARDLWTDIMLHCIREDLESGQFQRALDRAKHYLVLYPDDPAFLELKARSEQELKKPRFLNNTNK